MSVAWGRFGVPMGSSGARCGAEIGTRASIACGASEVSQLRSGVAVLRVGCWATGRVSGMPAGRFWVLAGRASRAGVVRAARSFLARWATGPGRITAGRMPFEILVHTFLASLAHPGPSTSPGLICLRLSRSLASPAVLQQPVRRPNPLTRSCWLSGAQTTADLSAQCAKWTPQRDACWAGSCGFLKWGISTFIFEKKTVEPLCVTALYRVWYLAIRYEYDRVS